MDHNVIFLGNLAIHFYLPCINLAVDLFCLSVQKSLYNICKNILIEHLLTWFISIADYRTTYHLSITMLNERKYYGIEFD